MVDKKRNRLIITGLMMGLLLSSLDQTITATAMPTIISKLGGISLYSWVFSVYMLTGTASIPLFGKLADLYGRKLIYLIGMGLFITGSALCGLANSMIELIIFRGIQGLGAGALMPLAMIIIGDIFPPHQRGKMQGVLGAVFGISSIAGPAIGGFITEHLDWHWVFFVNLPFGIAAAWILAIALKEHKGNRKPSIDWFGAATLTTAVVCILLITVLVSGKTDSAAVHWNSPYIIGLFALSIFLVGLFVWIESTAKEPILPLFLFKNRTIAVTCITGFFMGVGMFGAISFIPLFVQGVIGVSPSMAGYILTPLMLSVVLASTVGGLLITKFKYRTMLIFAMSIMTFGFFLLSTLSIHTTNTEMIVYMIITGLGMGIMMPVLTIAVQSSVGYEHRGVATSSMTFFRSIGGTLGVSIMGAVMTNKMAAGLLDMAANSSYISQDRFAALGNTQALLNPEIRAQMPPQLLEAVTKSLASSISWVFITALIFIVCGLIASFFMCDTQLVKPENKGLALE